uniref:Reverse transcriptase domain-containing protein n=1 Tax=Tanacetum cinerariifolium TaxID=118510 RepID=A0A6L2NFL4_TANCI|nr:hypothetical protein [Tanacetum cinerariifolium]
MQFLGEMILQREQAANLSNHTPEPSRRFNSICYDDDDYKESTIPLNEIVSQIPPSIAITPVLLTMKPKDSLTMGHEDLRTILENDSDEFIKSSVEDPVPITNLLVTPLFESNEDECFDPGGDVDEINAFDILSDFEDSYYDSEGDVLYLESLLSDDTTPNLPPKVFLDHDPRSLSDINDLNIMAAEQWALLQETIKENKVEADRQFAKIINAIKALQPPTTLPAIIPCFEEKSGESYTSSKVVKDSRFISDDVTKVGDSLREQGEDDWQPPYEPDLQDIQDMPDCCNLKPHMDGTQEGRACSKLSYCSFRPVLRCDNVLHLVVVQGLGSNYKRSGLEFYSTMILVVQLEPNILYGPLFEQRMTWDPRIT